MEYFCDVKGGKLSKGVTEKIRTDLLGLEGKRVHIIIKKKKKYRSLNQNAYYWGVIVGIFRTCLEDSSGEYVDKQEAHEFIKAQFNSREVVNKNTGEIARVAKSTTENTTTDQEEMHEKARRFAEEWWGVRIPLPNEQAAIDYEASEQQKPNTYSEP